jgi:hypothetical protein
MKFKLKTSGYFYKDEDKEKLLKLGFKFDPYIFKEYRWTKKDNVPEIEINSLNELVKFMEEWGDLILSPNAIEIYDNYRE